MIFSFLLIMNLLILLVEVHWKLLIQLLVILLLKLLMLQRYDYFVYNSHHSTIIRTIYIERR